MGRALNITEEQIREIQDRAKPNTDLNELAKEMGLSKSTIWKYSTMPKGKHDSKITDENEILKRARIQTEKFISILAKFEHFPINIVDNDRTRLRVSTIESSSYASCSLDW